MVSFAFRETTSTLELDVTSTSELAYKGLTQETVDETEIFHLIYIMSCFPTKSTNLQNLVTRIQVTKASSVYRV